MLLTVCLLIVVVRCSVVLDAAVVDRHLAAHNTSADFNVIRGDKIMVACGTRPARNDLYPFSSPLVFDSDQILQNPSWDKIRHLIVIGSGVIAMEYASMFNALPGCRITMIDEKPSILDFVDAEAVQTLRHIMGRQGATVSDNV